MHIIYIHIYIYTYFIQTYHLVDYLDRLLTTVAAGSKSTAAYPIQCILQRVEDLIPQLT